MSARGIRSGNNPWNCSIPWQFEPYKTGSLLRWSHSVFASPPAFPNLRPTCPIDCLPEPLRSAVLHVIQDKEAPAACALTDALAASAAVVHCGFDCVALDGERLPATINTCAVAPSGSGKGRSFKLFFKHFLNSRKWQSRRTAAVDAAGYGITPARIPRVETLVSRTISYAKLVEMLDGRSMTLTLQREDGRSLLKSTLFKDNIDALTQLWSGDPPLDNFVHGVELEATDARGSVGFRTQPKPMYKYATGQGQDDCAIGLWPRAVTGCHDPERFQENETYVLKRGRYSAEAFQARMEALTDEINQKRQCGDFSRTGVGLDLFARAYMYNLNYKLKEWIPREYRDIREAAARAWENTLRIAVVLHVFCGGVNSKVSVDTVQRAWAIVEWSLSQYRLVFVEAVAPPHAETVAATGATSLRPWHDPAPKAEKVPRPLQDAQWVLDCLDRLCPLFLRQTKLSEVRLLAGLPEKRFMTAVAWLKLEHIVTIHGTGQSAVIGYF
nr:DUF3987 domain-containing protein [Xanthomonas cannabis]